MQTITSSEQIAGLKDNQIIGNFAFENSKVTFSGTGNVLITPCNSDGGGKTCKLSNSSINFKGSNCLVFLDENRYTYIINVTLFYNSFFYCGKDCGFGDTVNIQCSEQRNVIIGNECLFSFEIWMRTSDVHPIYDTRSHARINPSESIFVGDHVWIGQTVKVLKGSQIGSGSIIGAGSILTGKTVPSHTSWAGNPARQLRSDVFYVDQSLHAFQDAETAITHYYTPDTWVYSYSETETIAFKDLESEILTLPTAKERADFLLWFSSHFGKNRFYIGT